MKKCNLKFILVLESIYDSSVIEYLPDLIFINFQVVLRIINLLLKCKDN